jgi:hypothetical protein
MSDRELAALTGKAPSKAKSKSKAKAKGAGSKAKKTAKGKKRGKAASKPKETAEEEVIQDVILDVPAESEAPVDVTPDKPNPVDIAVEEEEQEEVASQQEQSVRDLEAELAAAEAAEAQGLEAAVEVAEAQEDEAGASPAEIDEDIRSESSAAASPASPALSAEAVIDAIQPDAKPFEEIMSELAAAQPLDLPPELPELPPQEPSPSPSRSKSKSKSRSKSRTPPRSRSPTRVPSKSRSRSSSPVEQEVNIAELHPDVSQAMIGSTDFMQGLVRHIRTKSITSAKQCLNEINAFREIQIEKLLDATVTEDKLENIRSLRERLKAGDVTSRQPAGSFKEILNDIVGGYRLWALDDDENARKLADGYLEWIALQLELTIPKGRRNEAAALINKHLNKLLYPQSQNWVSFDDDEIVLNREGIIRAARTTATKEREEGEVIEKQKTDKRKKRAERAKQRTAEEQQLEEANVEREVERRVRSRSRGRGKAAAVEQDEEEDVPEKGGIKTVKRKKLTQQFLTSLGLTVQMSGVVSALFDELDMDRIPVTDSIEDWRQYVLGLRQYIEPFEKAYDQLKTKSDPFFTEYKEDNRYALPVPERSLVNVTDEEMTALMRKKQGDGGQTKTATLFLYNWIEDMWRAWGKTLQSIPELVAGPNLIDNLNVERDVASILTDSFAVVARDSLVSLTIKTAALSPTQATEALFAVSLCLVWLASNDGNLISINAPALEGIDGAQVVGNLTDVRDWIGDNLCVSIGDNKACKLLYKALKEVTGEPRNNLDRLLKKKLETLGLKIIEGGKEERAAINFEELCAQCKADDNSCAEGYFAVDQFPRGTSAANDEQARHNAEEYARALQPNHWLLKRAVSGKGGVPSYQTVDLRQNAVLLIAVQVGYELKSDAILKASIGTATATLEIPAGQWATAEAFVEAFNQATDGELRLSVKTSGEANFPDFTLHAKNNETFRIEQNAGSSELLQLLGMRFKESDRAVKSKNSVNALIATNRSMGFLLAVRSDTSFPEGASPHLQRIDSDTQISAETLSDSIEIDAICTGNKFDGPLKTLLLLWLLSRPELVRRLTNEPKKSLLLLDLPKRPVEHNFQSSKGGASGPVLTSVNSAQEWSFWTDVWKFQTGFPEKLAKKPSGYQSSEVYALDKSIAAFTRLKRRWKFATGVTEPDTVSEELEKKGPYSTRNASIWSGFMLRSIPDQSQLLSVAQTDL